MVVYHVKLRMLLLAQSHLEHRCALLAMKEVNVSMTVSNFRNGLKDGNVGLARQEDASFDYPSLLLRAWMALSEVA
jgi:hypothetical protein